MQRPVSGGSIQDPAGGFALITQQVQPERATCRSLQDLNQRKLKSGLGREFTDGPGA